MTCTHINIFYVTILTFLECWWIACVTVFQCYRIIILLTLLHSLHDNKSICLWQIELSCKELTSELYHLLLELMVLYKVSCVDFRTILLWKKKYNTIIMRFAVMELIWVLTIFIIPLSSIYILYLTIHLYYIFIVLCASGVNFFRFSWNFWCVMNAIELQ